MRSLFFVLVAAAGISSGGGVLAQEETAVQETVVQRTTHDVVTANTLWDLAQYYYKDPWQWPRIHEANTDKIKDPHWIYPGQQFVIPGFDRTVTVARKAPGAAPELVGSGESVDPEPAEEPEEPKPLPQSLPADAALVESLSTRFPEGLVGQQTSMQRRRLPKDWEPDGKVTLFAGRDSVAGIGDRISVRMGKPVDLRKGQPLTVYRYAGPTEADYGKNGKVIQGTYVARVGVVEVDRKLSEDEYRAVVVQASGAVHSEDVLKIGQE